MIDAIPKKSTSKSQKFEKLGEKDGIFGNIWMLLALDNKQKEGARYFWARNKESIW